MSYAKILIAGLLLAERGRMQPNIPSDILLIQTTSSHLLNVLEDLWGWNPFLCHDWSGSVQFEVASSFFLRLRLSFPAVG